MRVIERLLGHVDPDESCVSRPPAPSAGIVRPVFATVAGHECIAPVRQDGG